MASASYKPPDPVAEYRRTLESEAGLLPAAERLPSPDQMSNDGAALVRDLEIYFRRYIVLPPKTSLPLSLWAVATYLFESFDAFPYLAVSSPVPGCGKTRVIEIAELIVSNPQKASNISEAALFRVIEKFKPTLLLDEAETLKGKSERGEYLRQILNAGNRNGAVATRCVGQGANLDVKHFSVYCPKMVCGIGTFPPTIADRSICVPMQRRNREKDQLGRLQAARMESPLLQNQITAFAATNREQIEVVYRQTNLDFLGDRDADSWAPLFAILGVMDSARLAELRNCAEYLTAAKVDNAVEDSLTLRLLADVREAWPEDEPYIFSSVLAERLRTIEDGPWGESEVKLSQRKLAYMLKGFKLRPSTVRIGDRTAKGYSRAEFDAASFPYLGTDPSHPSQPL